MKTLSAILVITALAAPAGAQEPPRASAPVVSPGSFAPTVMPEPPDAPAQDERPAPPPPPPAPPPPGERRRLPTQNVRVEITISDQSGSSAPVKKVVSLLVADGRSSGVRSSSQVPVINRGGFQSINYKDLPLNVDATAVVTPEGKVLVDIKFNYGSLGDTSPRAAEPGGNPPGSGISHDHTSFGQITENLSVLLTPGKPLVIARSADAASDRTVTVEVKADVLK